MLDKQQKIEFLKGNLSRSIVFVGLMGAGKSSVGRALASALDVDFIDSDIEIERVEGISIPEIFAKSGETYFREREVYVISDLVEGKQRRVIGIGGGAFMNDKTRDVMKKKSISIFLDADLDVLVKRVGDGVGRPLFEGKQPRDVLAQLIKMRYPIYKQADMSVMTKDEPLQETLNRVIETLYTYIKQG
jgi:shikimate kinase